MGDVSEVGYSVRLPQEVVYTEPVEEAATDEVRGPENGEPIDGSEGLGNHVDVTA